jgi:hypothetical protein
VFDKCGSDFDAATTLSLVPSTRPPPVQHNLDSLLPRLTKHTTLLPNWKIYADPHCSGPVPTLESRNILPLCWHGTVATDCVIGSVLQQFSTNLNSAHFASRPTVWVGPTEGLHCLRLGVSKSLNFGLGTSNSVCHSFKLYLTN